MRARSRSAVLALAVIAIAVFLVPAAVSTGATGQKSYVVVMKADPAVAYDGGVAGIPATKPAKGKKINPNSAAVKKYSAHLTAQHDESLQDVGASAATKVNNYTIALNGYSAVLTDDQADALRAQKGVATVMEDELHQPTTDSSPQFLGLTAAGGAYATGVNGRGVIVGVIDTGIWPEHPSFADDGSYPAANVSRPVPCEFGNTAANPDDAPFTCNNKLVGARQELATYRSLLPLGNDFDSARDHAGHGTHTSSTSAGNAGVEATVLGIPRGKISGIAPRAHVIMYKGLGEQGGFTSDLVSAIDDAVADGVDVINYSIGGGASITGGDDIAFLFAADAGVFVASSAGNSGPGAGTVGGPGSVPWLTTVGASTQSRSFQGTVELGNGATYTGVSITPGIDEQTPLVDAANAGGDLCLLGTLNPAVVTGKIVLCRRGTNARIEKSEAVQEAGGVGMIMYENSDAGDLMSDSHWVPTVHVDNTPGVAIKAYIASAASPTASLVTNQLGTTANAPSMTQFSSRGPDTVALDIIKPDVTAPGIQILAGHSPFPDAGPTGELFQAIAGTSMSSPHVAGLFALLKQVHPDWSPAAAKSALMTTASQDVRSNDRTTQATPFEMGAGHVVPGRPNQKGSSFQPGLVYDAGFNEYLGFLCEAGPEVFGNPAATCAALANAGIPTTATGLNLASIGDSQLAGTATVSRTVTSVANESGNRTYSASFDAPDGYTVSVSPSSFTLKSGQSATFEVTITNVSAPLGEWRFGSLTWTDQTGNYKVSSPIAVNASKFAAPAEVTGSGVDGSTSFDILFGYTGEYEAVAHGLTPATLTDDNVLQDATPPPPASPVFDPSDVGAGGANAHTFALSDVSVFRVAIPPEATEADADLDIFLYDPNGDQVASSTSGGTNEEITVEDPADGTWTLYVHGWAAPGGDSDYTLYSWAVPNATGGSLVASGPTSATNGSVGTVNLTWTGAIGWNLGAVDHTEGSTVLGRTLVEVDNR